MDVVKTTGVHGESLYRFSPSFVFPRLPKARYTSALNRCYRTVSLRQSKIGHAQVTILHSFGDGSVPNDEIREPA